MSNDNWVRDFVMGNDYGIGGGTGGALGRGLYYQRQSQPTYTPPPMPVPDSTTPGFVGPSGRVVPARPAGPPPPPGPISKFFSAIWIGLGALSLVPLIPFLVPLYLGVRYHEKMVASKRLPFGWAIRKGERIEKCSKRTNNIASISVGLLFGGYMFIGAEETIRADLGWGGVGVAAFVGLIVGVQLIPWTGIVLQKTIHVAVFTVATAVSAVVMLAAYSIVALIFGWSMPWTWTWGM